MSKAIDTLLLIIFFALLIFAIVEFLPTFRKLFDLLMVFFGAI